MTNKILTGPRKIIIEWINDDACYFATVEGKPGLSAFGHTPQEALTELEVAEDLYDSAIENGQSILSGSTVASNKTTA